MHNRERLHPGKVAQHFRCIYARDNTPLRAYELVCFFASIAGAVHQAERIAWRVLQSIERMT
jgi:hypothetical protein